MNKTKNVFRGETSKIWKYLVFAAALIVIGLVTQNFLPLRETTSCLPAEVLSKLSVPDLIDVSLSGVSMFDITWNCGFSFGTGLFKALLLILVMRLWVNPVVATLMGFKNQLLMLADQQLKSDSNDSNAWTNSFALIAAGWIIFMTPLTTPMNYIANLAVRLPHAFIWAVVFTFIFVRFQLGIKTMDEYTENFRAPSTEAVAIWTNAAILLAAWLVVGVR